MPVTCLHGKTVMLFASALIALVTTVAAASEAKGELACEPPPLPSLNQPFIQRVRKALAKESAEAGVPEKLSEIVVQIESRFDPDVLGSVGEIGLMQVRPGTAAMLGFHGSLLDLANPEINVHYGVTYLASAWRLAGGDLCRTLMKYRAGLGEDAFTPRSVAYCNRAKDLLANENLQAAILKPPPAVQFRVTKDAARDDALNSVAAIYRKFKRGTPEASKAFWRMEMARVKMINARLEVQRRARRVNSVM
jgi:hypothetical protein